MHPKFIAALFSTARIWKKYVSINRGMDKEGVAICNKAGPGGYYALRNKSERERQILYDI